MWTAFGFVLRRPSEAGVGFLTLSIPPQVTRFLHSSPPEETLTVSPTQGRLTHQHTSPPGWERRGSGEKLRLGGEGGGGGGRCVRGPLPGLYRVKRCGALELPELQVSGCRVLETLQGASFVTPCVLIEMPRRAPIAEQHPGCASLHVPRCAQHPVTRSQGRFIKVGFRV